MGSSTNLDLTVTSLNNTHGVIGAAQSATVRLGKGLLDNTGGQLIGTQALVIQSGEIRNAAGTIGSGSGLALDTQGAALTNINGGQIVATGDVIVSSAKLDNSNGTIASINGQLQVNTNGQSLYNDGGKLQALGNTTINAGTASSQNGLISGQDITLHTGAFNNDNGTVAANGNISLDTKSLSNTAGLLQSVGDMQVSTGNDAIVNAHSGTAGGMIAGGNLNVSAGSLNNQSGFIASNGNQSVTLSGNLDNSAAGSIVSNGNTNVDAANINNQNGSINALGNVALKAGVIDNSAGAIAANGDIQFNATTLNNRAQNGVAGSINANNINATTTTLDNSGGTITAANDATFTSNTLTNTGGSLTAGHDLNVASTALGNTNGHIVGNNAVTLTTSSQAPGGTIASANNVTLNVNGDYLNNGLLSAQKDLTVNAANITNSGEISGQNVVINASGTLSNSTTGLIDAQDTRINAGTINNTGRIYGDMLRINAGTINNDSTGVIAARNTLLIGAQNLNNTNGAWIYSLGDIIIGGMLDANGNVQGAMQNLVNGSSKIEAGGNLTINAASILNRNDALVTTILSDPTVHQEYVRPDNGYKIVLPDGSLQTFDVSVCQHVGEGGDIVTCAVHPDKIGLRSDMTPVYSLDEQCSGNGENGYSCTTTTTVNYTWDSPVFAQFGIAPVGAPPAEPAICNTFAGLSSPQCTQWRADMADWNTRFDAVLGQLDTAITAYNAQVDEDNRVYPFEDYTWFKIDSTHSYTAVVSSKPGQIISGGGMNLTGMVVNNDSSIVAGGALNVTGPQPQNNGTKGIDRIDYSGTTQSTTVETCGSWPSQHHCRQGLEIINPYNPAPNVTTGIDLGTVQYVPYAGNQTATLTLVHGNGVADTSLANAVRAATGNDRGIAGQMVQTAMSGSTLTVPNNSLFIIHAAPSANYLVETDPRFTNYKTFISSDYFLAALQRDPSQQLKRYGDGFEEQQLVNDQILALTGRRYLDGYTDTETEYKGLMDAGVAFAQKYQLTPGVALTAEQMALLTTDIVWLTPQTVTLADGSTQQVLVPQVYLHRAQSGDLQPSGALMAGNSVTIQTTSNLVNSGTISGNSVNIVAGNDLVNQGGRISGQDVVLRANNDLKNLSGVITGTGADSTVSLLAGRDIILQTQTIGTVNNDGTSTRTNVQRIATVQGGNVTMAAGRDLTAQGASVTADQNLTAVANGNLTISAVAGQYQLNVADSSGKSVQGRTAYISEATTTNQLATFGSGGNMILAAGSDLTIKGADITAGTSGTGDAQLQGKNVTIAGVKDSQSTDIQTVGKKQYNRTERADETLVTGQVAAAGNVTVNATGGDVNVQGGYITSQNGQVALAASNDINIGTIDTQHSAIDESYYKGGNLLAKTATTTASKEQSTQAEGSTLSGSSVVIAAGDRTAGTGNVTVTGSQVVADNDVTIAAGNNVTLAAAAQQSQSSTYYDQQTSGMFSGGGIGVTIGSKELTQSQGGTSTTHVGSTVGSLNGNISIQAGNDYTQTGSQLIAHDDIDVAAKRIDIGAVVDAVSADNETKYKQSGLTVALSAPVISALQNVAQQAENTAKVKDSRMQVLGAMNTAMAGMDAANAMGATGAQLAQGQSPNVSISVTVGSSQSQSQQTQSATTATGSTVQAGGNVTLSATGDGSNSHLTVTGSDIAAGKNATLISDGDVTLQAAQNTAEQHSSNSSSSAAVGVAISVGQGGASFGVTASASAARGNADGNDVIQTNSHVSAGDTLTIQSGGDTNLKGAVASGNQVIANVGGNLNIDSLQDTSVYKSKSDNIGGSVTAGFGFSGSASYGNSKVNADYASVTEQSGIQAGDNGFQVKVNGNTDLKGGAIASTQAAIDGNKNSLTTGTLTTSDIANHADYSASSVSVGGGISMAGTGNNSNNLMSFGNGKGASAGFGSDSGSDSSVTRSGISQGKLTITDSQGQQQKTGQTAEQAVASVNRDIQTGDASGGIAKNWNGQQLQEQVQTEAQITQAFGAMAAKQIASYADGKQTDALAKAKAAYAAGDTEAAAAYAAEADKWGEGGTYRIALHTVAGGLSGGVDGALGAAASASSADLLNGVQSELQQKLTDMGVGKDTAAAIAQGATGAVVTGLGAALSGTAGATTAFNTDFNNRQLSTPEKELAKKLAAKSGGKYTTEQIEAQMRGMTMTTNGVTSPGSPAVVAGAVAPKDNGGTWIYAGTTADGKPIIVQQLAPEDAALRAFIVQNTTGSEVPSLITYAGPYTAPQVSTSSTALPPAPEGTQRATVMVDGVAYSPLVAPCPAAGCTNGDPIAYGISDPGTQAYVEAVNRKIEKDLNIGTAVLGVGGAIVRGLSTVGEIAAGSGAAGSNAVGTAGAIANNGAKAADAVADTSHFSAGVPPSILDSQGKLPPGIGGAGTPIPMQPSINPNATAEAFARAAFNGQTPDKIVPILSGDSWVAKLPDGSVVTFRVAGDASSATDAMTATVEVNSQAVKNMNNGNVAKFKFPGQ